MQAETFTKDLDLALPWFLEKPDPEVYLKGPWLCFDLETTNIEKGSALVPENRIVCAAWTYSTSAKVDYHRGHELDQKALLWHINNVLDCGGFLIGHAIKFDLQWMARAGLDLHKVLVYDTLLGDFVRAGNRRWPLDLDSVKQRYGGPGKTRLVNALISGGVCPSEIPEELLKARVIKDVKDTLHVFFAQRAALQAEGKLAVQYTRCLYTPVLADMETKGNKLDRDRVYEEHERATRELAAVTRELNRFTREKIEKLPDEHPLRKLCVADTLNPRSIPQMAYFVYDVLGFHEKTDRKGKPVRNAKSRRFPNGVPMVDEDTLLSLGARNATQQRFIELKKRAGSLASELSKTLHFYKGTVDEYDGVWYASFNQSVAQTHRLTSSGRKRTFRTVLDDKGRPKTLGIQGQNQPTKFKDLTRPKRPGWKMGNIDGSQLEFRAAAFLGQDEQAIHNIRHDVDQHILTASVIHSKEWESATPERRKFLRSKVKPHTFKPLYGGRSGTAEERAYYQWFSDQFPDLAEAQTAWTFEVLKTKELRLPWGMVYYWPHTRMSPDGYIDNTTAIFNYPVQGLATAEIIPVATTYLWHRAHVNDSRIELTNAIHDNALAEVPPDSEKLWETLGVRCFTLDTYNYLRVVYGLDFNVPLGVGVTIGDRWDSPDATEIEWNVDPSGDMWKKGSRAS